MAPRNSGARQAILKKNTQQFGFAANTEPLGSIKLKDALRELLAAKDFNSITTVEISRTSGVNEALIYRYFGDKRGLLHAVLSEYAEAFLSSVLLDLKNIEGAINKLRKLIWSSLCFYNTGRTFAKILLLEVRNYPGYFQSDTYNKIRQYSRIVLEIIEDGIKEGEFRDDIKPTHIRQLILGGLEHLILPAVIYEKEMDVEQLYEDLCSLVFNGVRP